MDKIRLVHGIGTNDAGYVVCPTVNGRRILCPIYMSWHAMLTRCYSAAYHAKYPTYIGCTVTPEWHSFSAFRAWMLTQEHEGKHLDKDILFPGNKVYSPHTCVFVSGPLNKFLNRHESGRGEWPIGVCWNKQSKKFQAFCCNPFTGKQDLIGYFTDPDIAHEAWRRRKHETAYQYADHQTDERIAKALRQRFAATTGATE